MMNLVSIIQNFEFVLIFIPIFVIFYELDNFSIAIAKIDVSLSMNYLTANFFILKLANINCIKKF